MTRIFTFLTVSLLDETNGESVAVKCKTNKSGISHIVVVVGNIRVNFGQKSQGSKGNEGTKEKKKTKETLVTLTNVKDLCF